MNTEFGMFWSWVWEMQVAARFLQGGCDVRWHQSPSVNGNRQPGPDLHVAKDGSHLYVECLNDRGSHGILEFIRELFRHIDSNIRVRHRLWDAITIPKNERFLDALFRPFLADGHIQKLREAAAREWPVPVPLPPDSVGLDINMVGQEQPKERLSIEAIGNAAAGDPECYLWQWQKRVVGKKANRNALDEHRPNLLAVNCALSADVQIAMRWQLQSWDTPSLRQLPHQLDSLAFSATGIDQDEAHLVLEPASKDLPAPFAGIVRRPTPLPPTPPESCREPG